MLREALHMPGKTLKQAEAWYHNAMHRLEVQGHGLRYAFARERVEAYLQSGIPMAEGWRVSAWTWDMEMGVDEDGLFAVAKR